MLSEEKCELNPEFRVEVLGDKKVRIVEMAKELMDSYTDSARQMAAFTGLVISCTPSIGKSARFYMGTASILEYYVCSDAG